MVISRIQRASRKKPDDVKVLERINNNFVAQIAAIKDRLGPDDADLELLDGDDTTAPLNIRDAGTAGSQPVEGRVGAPLHTRQLLHASTHGCAAHARPAVAAARAVCDVSTTPRRLLAGSATATNYDAPTSPPTPRSAARDSSAMMSPCSSRERSDLSTASGGSTAGRRGTSADMPARRGTENQTSSESPLRRRGRPAGKNRVPLSREERRAHHGQYERERRNETAEATSQLFEAANCDPNISKAKLLATVISRNQRIGTHQ